MKHKFKPWGSPEIFKSAPSFYKESGTALFVYAKRGLVSLKSVVPNNDGSCVVLTPATIKGLIKLLKRTVD